MGHHERAHALHELAIWHLPHAYRIVAEKADPLAATIDASSARRVEFEHRARVKRQRAVELAAAVRSAPQLDRAIARSA